MVMPTSAGIPSAFIALTFRRSQKFCASALGAAKGYFGAAFQATDAGPETDDNAGALAAEDGRRRRPVDAIALIDVGVVDAIRRDLDQRLTVPGAGNGTSL